MRHAAKGLMLSALLVFGISATAQYNPNAPQNQPGQYDQNGNPINNNGQGTYNNGQGTYNNGTYNNTSTNNAVIGSGTEIQVQTDQAINVKGGNNNNTNSTNSTNSTNNGTYAGQQMFPATVSKDVLDTQGRVAIPAGSQVQLTAVPTSDNNMTLDIQSITVNGQTFNVYSDSTSAAGTNKNGGLGANKRTGTYVGGGALAGTLLGAIAGGAKGAVIGAIAGGAAGAGAQVITRGKDLSVPAETKLTFRINRQLDLGPYQTPQRSPMPTPR